MAFSMLNDPRVFVLASAGAATGVSVAVAGKDADFIQIIAAPGVGSMQVEVSNDGVVFSLVGSAFTAAGNMVLDPMWRWVRVNVTSYTSGTFAASYVLGERHH